LELAFLSSPRKVRQGVQWLRWPLVIGGTILSIPGFLYVIAEIANSEPGSPRYPLSLAVCAMFAVGMTIWLILAVFTSLPRPNPVPDQDPATSPKDYNGKARIAACAVLMITLTFLSGALRASAIFEPTKLVVRGFFPWQDSTHPYSKLVAVQSIDFGYHSGPDTKTETGFRLVFSDGGVFDLGPTWRWLCPRDKEDVDNRIMALLQPHLATLADRLVSNHPTPYPTPSLSQQFEPKEYGIDPERPIKDQIAHLEAYLKAHPEPFDSYGHNLLRHLYLAVDERKAMEECDLIFAHSFMDEYTLQCLSDWNLDKRPDQAVKNLLQVSRKYPDLKFLNAACTLEIARLYKQLNNAPDAGRFMAQLVEARDSELSAYRTAAENAD
jgi:hypothetical protein